MNEGRICKFHRYDPNIGSHNNEKTIKNTNRHDKTAAEYTEHWAGNLTGINYSSTTK